MKKLFFMVCCAALLMTGCKDGKNAPGLASVQQTDSLNDVIAQKDSEINEMMGTLNDIEEGFRLINEAENRVALLKNGEGTSKKTEFQGKHPVYCRAHEAEQRADCQVAETVGKQYLEGWTTQEDHR
jgi:hypothetical protein